MCYSPFEGQSYGWIVDTSTHAPSRSCVSNLTSIIKFQRLLTSTFEERSLKGLESSLIEHGSDCTESKIMGCTESLT